MSFPSGVTVCMSSGGGVAQLYTRTLGSRCSRLLRHARVALELFCFPATTEYLKGKAIPLQVWTGPEGSRRSRLPDLLRQSAHEGGKLSRSQGRSAALKDRQLKSFNDTIGNRSRYLRVCSIVPQPLRHRVPPTEYLVLIIKRGPSWY
jgi:hypothetical protein